MMQAGSVSGGQKQTAATALRGLHAQLPEGQLLGLLLGPIAGLVLWWLPLGLEPVRTEPLPLSVSCLCIG